MKLKRTNHCKECPFNKTSLQGWLGPYKVQDISQMTHDEGGFPCHMSVNVLVKNGATDQELIDKSHVCVGSLQSANKSCKSYRNPELHDWQKQVGKPDNIMDRWQFEEYHANIPDPRKRRK